MQIPNNRQAERRAQDRIETQIANRFETRLQREISRSIRDGADAYEAGSSIESAVASHDDAVRRAIERMYTDAYTQIGERVLDQIEQSSKSAPRLERKELPDAIRRTLDAFISRWAEFKAMEISSTTRNWIRQSVQRGIEDGLGVDDVGAMIRGRAPEISAYRAHMISRTETHSAANAASLDVAEDSGIVRIKVWVPVDDHRTRRGEFDHVNVDPVPIGEPFLVSGEELRHPGDPAGSPGNIINCRCAMVYETR